MAILALQRFKTLADVIDHLGVPAGRILLDPKPGTAIEQDVTYLDDHEDRLAELVDGVLVEKAMGFYESQLGIRLGGLIDEFVRKRRLGVVAGADATMRLGPGLVRLPDISVVLWERMPGRRIPTESIPDLAPDLAIEIVSKGNTEREMQRKIREYFTAGTQAVWLLDPRSRTMRAYSSPERFEVFAENDTVDGGEVLPGFILSLADLFTEVDIDFESE